KQIRFKVSKYDRAKPLVIDPMLKYFSLVNASGEGYSITADAAGNAYITGFSDANLNTTPGVAQPSFCGGGQDWFVTKLNAKGDDVLFTTYLGGPGDDYGNDIVVDAVGNIYVGGATTGGFPTTGGAYQTVPGGEVDGFLTKLNATGSALVFSTLLGGNS